MAFIDRIKVDLYGQYNNNTEHAYSYPDKITNQYSFTEATQWAAAITDPRALFQSVCKTGPCYMIYRHKNGYYYSYVERNMGDSRGGLEMITIFIPNGILATGYSVLAALKDLRALLIGSRRYDSTMVKNCVSRITESKSKELFPPKTQQNPIGQPSAAYRTYKEESELAELFTFLKQSEYATVDKLLFVNETDIKEGTSIQRITQPIKRVFTIVTSPNVRADKTEISVGESFHVTYTKDDCEPIDINLVLDTTPSNKFKIEGNEIILFNADTLRYSFKKRIYFDVKSADISQQKIDNAEVVFDGRPCSKASNGRFYALIEEGEIFDGSKATVTVSAPHYETKPFSFDLSNIKHNSTYPLVIKPKEVSVPICFCFKDPIEERGDDAILPVFDLPMNETDPLLRKLEKEHRFYGYPADHLVNGQYRIAIPHASKNKHGHNSQKRFPTWLKVVLISLGSIILTLVLFLGGYLLRHFEILEFPGLPIKSQPRQEQEYHQPASQTDSSAQADTTLHVQTVSENTVE